MAKIGIMSYNDFKERTLAVARGEVRIPVDEPKIWYSSIEDMMDDKDRIISELTKIEPLLEIETDAVAAYSLEIRYNEISERLNAIVEYLKEHGD